jgi:hypothetical protein
VTGETTSLNLPVTSEPFQATRASVTGDAFVTKVGTIGAATHLRVTASVSSVAAGTSFRITVSARDATGVIAPSYRGTVRFTSSDGYAALPDDYTFTAADAGVKTFAVTLGTADTQTITATDTVSGSLTATVSVTVVPGPLAFYWIYPDFDTPTSGVPFDLYVFPFDAFGNLLTDYTGEIAFYSPDETDLLPAPYTFTVNDMGMAYFFEGATLFTPGIHELYVFDTATFEIYGFASYDVLGGDSPGGAPGGVDPSILPALLEGIEPARLLDGEPAGLARMPGRPLRSQGAHSKLVPVAGQEEKRGTGLSSGGSLTPRWWPGQEDSWLTLDEVLIGAIRKSF